jgi:hypothetical protein
MSQSSNATAYYFFYCILSTHSVTPIKLYGLLLFSSVNYLVPFQVPLSEKLLATLGALEWLHTQMLLLVVGKIFLVPENIV